MKVVIDISEEQYKFCLPYKNLPKGEHPIEILMRAVADGIPLPKGHGRLIDADGIDQVIKPLEASDSAWVMTAETAKRLMYEAFNRCSTIIEADKGE